MPRGANPNSHRNKPTIPGLKSSEISLFSEQWAFLKTIGQGNKSRGAREVIRAMQIIANRNWNEAAIILNCKPTAEAIASRLVEYFPAISRGRKNQHDLVQELALGECSLLPDFHIEGDVVRVVNLAAIEVVNDDRKLVEAYQQLASGEIFPRNIKGVAEKIQYPESPEEGAKRGLMEELSVSPATLTYLGESFDKNHRSKYEGIESYARKHQFRATLHPEDIKDEYIEERDGDKTVFKWM